MKSRKDYSLNIEHIDKLLEDIRRLEENLNTEETPTIEEKEETADSINKQSFITRLKTILSQKFKI